MERVEGRIFNDTALAELPLAERRPDLDGGRRHAGRDAPHSGPTR
jgi:hypothetical protein